MESRYTEYEKESGLKSKNGSLRGGHRLRRGQRLGKYRIEACLWDGNYAAVHRAYDTIEGIRVALKIPHVHLMDDQFLEDFRHEVRLAAKLDHDHVLSIKNASFIGDYFVIVYLLGEETLADRMARRLSTSSILDLAEQAIEAVAHAHQHRIIHCDIKPENFILFPGQRMRLTDFGIAKLTLRTMEASGSGTLGYIAPEQAMGKPSFRSDVFSLGLILYKMFSGCLPEWPFDWPPAGVARLRKKAHPDLIAVIRKALEVKPARRYADAQQMLDAFQRVKSKSLAHGTKQGRRRKNGTARRDWRQVRFDQFRKTFGRALQTRYDCRKCGGPVSEFMRACPWCGSSRKKHSEETAFPARCPRCERGLKLDWRYCPWCYGPGFENISSREYSDKRYEARCSNPACKRNVLMPFMRYCPQCRRAVKKKWKVEGSREKCASCGWGVAGNFWMYCPWCSKRIAKNR